MSEDKYTDIPKRIGLAEGDDGPRLGFIFECQPGGPDSQVYSKFLEKLFEAGEVSGHHFVPLSLGNKESMIQDCGEAARNLLTECHHVFICWDLFPAWQPKPKKPCRHEDRARILALLEDEQVSPESVTLICISEELEAWLIADGNAFAGMAKRDAAPRVKHNSGPDSAPNPKTNLMKRWKDELRRGAYSDWIHAVELANASDLKRVAKSESFRRFVCKVKKVIPGNSQELCNCQ